MHLAHHSLPEQILRYAAQLPEGAPVVAKRLLHLGNRAAVDQALSRLAKRGQLFRAGRGLYLRPVSGRFGSRAPAVEQFVSALAEARGEVVARSGATAANELGLTTQVPVRSVFLTSGRTRTLRLGGQRIELRHAPRWQLTLPTQPGGQAVRALAWLGPEHAGTAITALKQRLPSSAFQEMAAVAPQLPEWLARGGTAAASG